METQKTFSKLLTYVFLGVLLSGCSGDDLGGEDDFFSADIEGEFFEVNQLTGSMESEKRISDYGAIDLSVKVISENGKTIEFLIQNYDGQKNYNIGKSMYDDSWISYTQLTPAGNWKANRGSANYSVHPNEIKITDDTGEALTGAFTFQGRDAVSGTLMIIKEGNFRIRY